VNVDFDSFEVPGDTVSRVVDLKYEYASTGDIVEDTINLKKEN
jgi:hypothetical protein